MPRCLKLATGVSALWAYFAAGADPNAPIRIEDYPGTIRVACVGDSITAGVGAAAGQSYPDRRRIAPPQRLGSAPRQATVSGMI